MSPHSGLAAADVPSPYPHIALTLSLSHGARELLLHPLTTEYLGWTGLRLPRPSGEGRGEGTLRWDVGYQNE